jgi:hypothetical protein
VGDADTTGKGDGEKPLPGEDVAEDVAEGRRLGEPDPAVLEPAPADRG